MSLRELILTIAFSLLVACAAISVAAPTNNDFDSPGTAYTIGQAADLAFLPVEAGGPSGDFLRLTNGGANQNNRAAFDRTALGLYKTLTASFDFRLTPVTGQADGMGVAFLRTADAGTTGNGPAYNEEPNLSGGSGAMLGIGLDIYNNGASPDNNNNNHMSLHANGLVGAVVDPGFDFSNNQFHRANVTWDYVQGGSQVTLTVTPDIFGTPGAPVTVFNKAYIPGLYPYESRISFSARTGGETANQEIDNVSVNYSLPSPLGWNYKPNFAGVAGDFTFVTDGVGGGFTGINGSNQLQITDTTNDQTGSAWHTSKVNVTRGFVTEFEFDFTNPSTDGADGISFNVHNEGLGYLTSEGTDQSDVLKVSLDSYGGGGSPRGLFVFAGLTQLGNFDPFDFSGTGPHTVRITYTPGDLDVFFDNAAVLSNLNVNLATLGAQDGSGLAWVGFGGRTGGENENHLINYWSFVVPEPSSVCLSALGLAGVLAIRRRNARSA